MRNLSRKRNDSEGWEEIKWKSLILRSKYFAQSEKKKIEKNEISVRKSSTSETKEFCKSLLN